LKYILTAPKAKKSLGQHFITDPAMGQKMAGILRGLGSEYHHILEVGPGKGILTKALLANTDSQTFLEAVEFDDYWQDYLVKQFPQLRGKIWKESVLELDFDHHFEGKKWGLIGNFPYNIASQIILKAAASHQLIPELAGMFQLEVAQRLTSDSGSRQYGMLSILFQAFYEAKLMFKISPGAFSPPPKVYSAAVRGTHRPEHEVLVPFHWLKPVVKQAFSQRRKKLSNTLKAYRDQVALEDPGLLDKRPEALSPDCYQRIASHIGEAQGWPK
jgi:16S rRNA (adenine1518-N6/adenine1519-N6)-dimethyltransferase